MKERCVSTHRPLLLSVTGLVLLAMHANANLITNPSFELGGFVDQGGATMVLPVGSTAITGWTVSTDQLAWIDAVNPWGLSAQDGTRFLDLTAYPAGAPFGGVSQTIATVAGEQYELSAYVGSYTSRWGGPPVQITASAGGTSQSFAITTTSTSSTWTPFNMLFTASGPTTTVSLTGTAGFQYIGLDNVSVEGLGGGDPGAVPEPGTYALMTTGLLAAAVLRRWIKA
jgi:Protein of unknown function (DUF642)/PEP-CTERM motif